MERQSWFMRRLVVGPAAALLAALSFAGSVEAIVALDPTFGAGGKVTTNFGGSDLASALAIQADGKLVAAGVSCVLPSCHFTLARYNTNGSLDSTFGTGGTVTTDFGGGSDLASALAIQADGKLVAAGRSGGDFALARCNTNGTPDLTFSTGGTVTTDFGGTFDAAFALAIQADGRLVAAGGSGSDFALARYISIGLPSTGLKK